jgi:type IV pilus assembly protein PilC
LIFAAIFKRYTSGKGKKKIDQFKLKLPIIGLLNQKILLSRFSRTLSALIGSGITILQALEIVRKVVQNEIIRQEIDHIKDSVRKGYSIATTIQGSKIFPPMVVQMIRIGEESGTLEEMLSKIADYYENETKNMVERLSSLVEPALILLMAFVVGFIVISVVVPMLEIYDMVG